MNNLVGIVILTYKNYSDTKECLESILKSDYYPIQVWVVDNGSEDETIQLLVAEFPKIHTIQTGKNLGVAGGFNAGIIKALDNGADYILILNNDTVVEPDTIKILVSESQNHPDYGILMPKILYYDSPNCIWSIGARHRFFPPAIVMIGLNQKDGPEYSKPRFLDYAPTCALLIPKQVFEKVGLLDESYFLFYDDWDYSLRVRASGFKIAYIPQARVYHKVSKTIKNMRKASSFWYLWGCSAGYFYRRHGRPPLLSALVHLSYLALREGLHNGPTVVFHFIAGAVKGYFKPISPYKYLSK
ncbi:MAG: hypothetical protein APU95_00750 [Hadesarchaea archaeon YNP_N21]|jgi:GT2 family glycosyltransferase|nr:MAG: hypothetical protein APU95_00750 [Hadesarchaea archaeon YNP_N21]